MPDRYAYKMQNVLFILGALVASCVAATPRSCGAPDPTEEQISLAQNFFKVEQEARLAGNAVSAAQTIEVNVYFHVLSTSNATEDGYISVCNQKFTCRNPGFLKIWGADIHRRRVPSRTSWML